MVVAERIVDLLEPVEIKEEKPYLLVVPGCRLQHVIDAVRQSDGREHLVPFTREAVPGVDVPGRVLTQTKTNVHVKVGQSIMLSGFKESTESLNASGIPVVGCSESLNPIRS